MSYLQQFLDYRISFPRTDWDVTCDSGYCSSVCCMYAIKEAVIAKEHSETPLDITIFNMDIRTYGKEFEKYYERAKQEHNIRFLRSKVYGIEEIDTTGNLNVKYANIAGEIKEEEFDIVVLSVGLKPESSAVSLAERIGISLNKYNFCETTPFYPVHTSKPGIYVCGAFQGPKDIPETVMEASSAAAHSSALLSSVRGSLVTDEKEYPKERVVIGEPPRIGVFICHCGINIGGVLDIASLKQFVKSLPNVVFTDDNLYTCSSDTQGIIKEMIDEHSINRVVVASCSPRTHEPLFQETIREAGLNPYLFEMVNIRDQCSWVHMDEPELATKKAKDLIDMAISKARLLVPLKMVSLTTTPVGLVIGGGIAGMVSALNLAQQGFEVNLLEKGMSLGGLAKKVYTTLNGEDVQQYVKDLTKSVTDHPLVNVYTRVKILESEGYIGNFTTKITSGSKKDIIEIKHGTVIIATGAEEYKPEEYFCKKSRNVTTLLDLESDIAKKSKRIANVKNVVMINCVGSRDEERPYCSRVCCSQSIKCALNLKTQNPEVNIYILYRDIRTYGFSEDYYRQAREEGIIFIQYEPENPPDVKMDKIQGKEVLTVQLKDPVLGQDFIIDADIVALAAGTIPLKTNKDLSQMFKVPLNGDGFFLEAHMKLRPVDFATDGVFVCGLAHNPKSISETIVQANAAASRASIILSKEIVELEGTVSIVNKNKCSGCGLCEAVCAFKAITIDPEENVAVINEALCKGCGACVASCRGGAIDLYGFSNKQIFSMLKTI
ncbi:MAG: FAD-dependent oxidoreductase [Thermodesulfobacteriota bacterium]|nr:FAD-dependent oxidoreductase [Thermodesulfobacteriota bacterium]